VFKHHSLSSETIDKTHWMFVVRIIPNTPTQWVYQMQYC